MDPIDRNMTGLRQSWLLGGILGPRWVLVLDLSAGAQKPAWGSNSLDFGQPSKSAGDHHLSNTHVESQPLCSKTTCCCFPGGNVLTPKGFVGAFCQHKYRPSHIRVLKDVNNPFLALNRCFGNIWALRGFRAFGQDEADQKPFSNTGQHVGC